MSETTYAAARDKRPARRVNAVAIAALAACVICWILWSDTGSGPAYPASKFAASTPVPHTAERVAPERVPGSAPAARSRPFLAVPQMRPATIAERDRSGASGAAAPAPEMGPPIPVDGVSEVAVQAYMANAAPNLRASDALSGGYLKRLRDDHALHFTDSIDCRGSICKTVLVFEDQAELAKLGGIEVDVDAEFTYRLDLERAPRELTISPPNAGRRLQIYSVPPRNRRNAARLPRVGGNHRWAMLQLD